MPRSVSRGGGLQPAPARPAAPAQRTLTELTRRPALPLSLRRTDGGFTILAQVPAPPACGRSERGRHGGHQPAWPRADIHFPGDPVHRRHRLPEHRCKEAWGLGARRAAAASPRTSPQPRPSRVRALTSATAVSVAPFRRRARGLLGTFSE